MLVWRSVSSVVRRRFTSSLNNSRPLITTDISFVDSETPAKSKKAKAVKPAKFALADRTFRSSVSVPGVAMVTDGVSASKAASRLLSLNDTPVAWHFEFTDVDDSRYTSFAKGKLVSATAYVVEDLARSEIKDNVIFVDTWKDAGEETLPFFKDYFESSAHPKVIHESHTAAHLLFRAQGILLRGLLANTRYLARLTDTSLASWEGKETTAKIVKRREEWGDEAEEGEEKGYALPELAAHFGIHKSSWRSFCHRCDLPPDPASAHLDQRYFECWVDHCAGNAWAVAKVFGILRKFLSQTPWRSDVFRKTNSLSLWDFALLIFRPLAEFLVDIERRGFAIDQEFLFKLRDETLSALDHHSSEFYSTAASLQIGERALNPAALLLNPRSTVMLRQLLFGASPFDKIARKKKAEKELVFDGEVGESTGADGRHWFKVNGIGLTPLGDKKSKFFTRSGVEKVSYDVLGLLAGKEGEVGLAYEQLISKGADEHYAKSVCKMLFHTERLLKTGSTVNHVVEPILDRLCVDDMRLHCSLSLDTSTGRLVSRKPNLQNPPTNDLRKAFKAGRGDPILGQNQLIVADYSQLELRILAHVSNCESMIKNLNSGGDYHSQTAVDMFPEIAALVKSGEIAINDVKGRFGTQRAYAKTLNFSIVYGKSVKSLAEDLKVSVQQASDLLDKWFSTKQEVKRWKERIIATAKQTNFAHSLLGRPRYFPHIGDPRLGKRSERAAVNHCIQGSAADIALCAMLRVREDQLLKKFGFHMVLQVHDEFILDGPACYAEEGKERLKELMQNPFAFINPDYRFKVPMLVDADIGDTWADAKP